jgi:RNA recognition motif-containing protein
MDVYIGNLPFSFREEHVRELVAPFGDVESVRIVTDRDTGRSRGFAFVTFLDDAAAKAAIAKLSGREVEGRALVVNEAQPRAERGGRPRGQGGIGRGREGGGWGGRGGRY